jgi:hypothetical protein
MVVNFSEGFLKELKKHTGKKKAKQLIMKLMKTVSSDGKFIALVKNVLIKERKLKSFRFYFVMQQDRIEIMTRQEIKDRIIKFVALSKKNNQQEVIDKLKKDLIENGFSI